MALPPLFSGAPPPPFCFSLCRCCIASVCGVLYSLFAPPLDPLVLLSSPACTQGEHALRMLIRTGTRWYLLSHEATQKGKRAGRHRWV